MIRYRAEIYDKNFNFKSYGAIAEKDIKIDYLTEQTSTFTIPEIVDASISDYVCLRQNGKIYLHGIVSSVEYDEHLTKISFIHFMSCLNVDLMINPDDFETTSVEAWFSEKLLALYQGDDSYQNIQGFSCSYTSETMILYQRQSEPAEDGTTTLETLNLFTFAQELLQKYGIIFTWSVDFVNKAVNCVISTIDTSSVWNLKLGIADTPNFSIDIHTIEGNFNKIKYYNEADVTDTVTYYLHSDGQIDTDDSANRLIPVTYTEKTAQADDTEGAEKTFAEIALEDAQASMINTDFNHEIIVTFNADSKLVSVGAIGQLYNLITPDGVAYKSILTGFEEVNVRYLKLVFGYIRTDLTSILKMQRRK